MLAMNGSRNDRRRETSQRSYLDDSTRREDADQSGKEKIIARTDSSGISNIIEIDHRMEEIELAGRGNFSRIAELLGKLPILDLELLPVLEFADIEVTRIRRRRVGSQRLPDSANKMEASTGRAVTKKVPAFRQRKFHKECNLRRRGQKRKRRSPRRPPLGILSKGAA